MARKTPELNASSMADIAFLLLIFFLVTTTMDVDSGIYRKLPPMPDPSEELVDAKVKPRNVLEVLINDSDLLQVGGDVLNIRNLNAKVKDFIQNPAHNPKYSESKAKDVPFFGNVQVSKGIVSLQSHVGTSYEMYIRIQDELATAFNEMKDEKSLQEFGKRFADLNEEQQSAVKKYVPTAISEAEPKKLGRK
jgi:biopolymer transport protein ExbD